MLRDLLMVGDRMNPLESWMKTVNGMYAQRKSGRPPSLLMSSLTSHSCFSYVT